MFLTLVRERRLEVARLAALTVLVSLSAQLPAAAGEAEAKQLFKAMSDYLAAQTTLSFDYDTSLEVVTADKQKLALASSGTVTLSRPDKIHMTRTGGFADVEMVFDGKTLSLLGKNANAYVQAEVPGSVDKLIDELRDTYKRPLPGADLLLSNVNDQLIPLVVDVKDLGSGVIGGVECDHFAFRTDEVDWQIWIAQGDRPYPCRYVVTSKSVEGYPQYTLDLSGWKTGGEVASADFAFTAPAGAKKIEPGDLADFDELPAQFSLGEKK
jgi:hypothetical protein